MSRLVVWNCWFLALFVSVQSVPLDPVFEWKELDFVWARAGDREEAISKKLYIPENNLPLGLARWKDRLFLTVPSWKAGVASTLNYVRLDSTERSPVLTPYPDFQVRSDPGALNTNNSLVSVFRVRVDEPCQRLWMVDTGLEDILGDPKQVHPPTVVVFDLQTDKLLRRYELPPSVLKEDTFFANIVVETNHGDCENSFAYIPDLGGYGIVVYDWAKNVAWRVKHNYFHFEPLAGDYNVGGVNFQWTDGVFGLALSRVQPDGNRILYFHALSGTKEFAVNTGILKNETVASDPHTYHEYKVLGERGPLTQASASYLDENSEVLFMSQVNRDGVACWNTRKPLSPDTLGLVAQDNVTLVFPNDITIDNENNLWVLSDKMPVFIYRSLSPEEVNYRIMKTKITDAISNTVCA